MKDRMKIGVVDPGEPQEKRNSQTAVDSYMESNTPTQSANSSHAGFLVPSG